MKTVTGRCLCGGVRYELTAKPLWVAHCHCESCRLNTGCVIVTFVGFSVTAMKYVAGAPKTFESSPGVRRRFCGDCGTPLTYEADKYPDEVHVYVSALDDPEQYHAQCHVHTSEQLSWFNCHDDLPRFAGTSKPST